MLALPALLVSMDLTVLHLAVPDLSADLRPSSSQLLWIVDIYGFMIAGFLITMGTLGDRIGRRRLLLRISLGALLLALAVGAAMIAVGLVLVFSGDQQGAYAGGWFKLAHFVAMHGIAILPGLAWLALRTDWTQRRRSQVVASERPVTCSPPLWPSSQSPPGMPRRCCPSRRGSPPPPAPWPCWSQVVSSSAA